MEVIAPTVKVIPPSICGSVSFPKIGEKIHCNQISENKTQKPQKMYIDGDVIFGVYIQILRSV